MLVYWRIYASLGLGVKPTIVWSSKELQTLDLNIGHQDSSPMNGHQSDKINRNVSRVLDLSSPLSHLSPGHLHYHADQGLELLKLRTSISPRGIFPILQKSHYIWFKLHSHLVNKNTISNRELKLIGYLETWGNCKTVESVFSPPPLYFSTFQRIGEVRKTFEIIVGFDHGLPCRVKNMARGTQ